jgi:PAS domain S-box-containing protein
MAESFDTGAFNQQVRAAQNRFHQLQSQFAQFSWSQNETVAETMEELSIVLDELHVASAEICKQYEYLMTAQESLLEEHQRYLDLFEFAPNSYIVTDTEGRIRNANRAAVSLLGLTCDRLIGKLIIAFVPDADRKTFRANLAQVQQSGTSSQNWEGHIQKQQSGSLIPCEMTIARLSNAEKKITELLWLIRDVSERKRIVEMETTSQLKDEFLAIVSHELRSPLNPILGWSRLLRTHKLDEPTTTKALEAIERNVNTQVRLIEDLLDVSHILRSKISLSHAQVNLKSVIKAALETVSLSAAEKGVNLQFEDPDTSICVMGDSTRLQQVVWNLLTNGIKFTPTGGRVEVRLEQVEGNREQGTEDREQGIEKSVTSSLSPISSYAQITVTDTGKGISADFLPYVFDHFRQADSSITRKFGGLGLGLAIVQFLVEAHGGSVQAESLGEGQGATFRVRLPLLNTEITQTESEASNPNQPATSFLASPIELQVLTVDDKKDTLARFGFC